MDSATHPNSINIHLPAKKAGWGAWLLTFLLASPPFAVLAVKPLNDVATATVTAFRWFRAVADPIVSLRNAIIGQESGGRADAVNHSSSGATGLGQVMPENISDWSQQCLGRSLSREEFKADADLQTQIIDCKLREYWNQVDGDDATRVRKVAAMWYSGRSDLYDNPTPQSWGGNSYPSIRDYTLKVLDRWESEMQSSPDAPATGKAIPFKGIQVTSAKDASGEPGLDYVVENGARGAEFGALAAGEVVEVVADQDWESHLEAGDTRRGYGNLVVVRVNESGEEVDMLYAHLDRVDVKEGDRLEVGSVIGTQGRTGSTTGAHVSVDFFAPGTRSANAASLAMRDRIAGILQSNPDALNQQIQSAPLAPPQLPPITEVVSLAKLELPKDLRLPSFQEFTAAPQAAVSSLSFGTQNNANVTDPDRFTVQIWINTDSGTAPASGIIIRQDGLILTNHHVIANGFLYVKTKDGRQFSGRTIASDANLDLALVQLDGASGLPVAPLAESANVQPGDMVKAIGHPNGEAWKHTEAQILAVDSLCGLKALDGKCIRTPSGFLHPGNSGGSLLNAQGEVIGINRAISEANGEGVSIPIEIFHQQFKMP